MAGRGRTGSVAAWLPRASPPPSPCAGRPRCSGSRPPCWPPTCWTTASCSRSPARPPATILVSGLVPLGAPRRSRPGPSRGCGAGARGVARPAAGPPGRPERLGGPLLRREDRAVGGRLDRAPRPGRRAAPARPGHAGRCGPRAAWTTARPGATGGGRSRRSASSSSRRSWRSPLAVAYVGAHVARAGVPAARLGAPHEDVDAAHERRAAARRAGTSRRATAPPCSSSPAGPVPAGRRACSSATATASCSTTVEAKAAARATRTAGAGTSTSDIRAGLDFLEHRPDVDRGRIGGLGLSVGGEMLLETAASTPALAAVVAEGAGARTMGEELDDVSAASSKVRAVL